MTALGQLNTMVPCSANIWDIGGMRRIFRLSLYHLTDLIRWRNRNFLSVYSSLSLWSQMCRTLLFWYETRGNSPCSAFWEFSNMTASEIPNWKRDTNPEYFLARTFIFHRARHGICSIWDLHPSTRVTCRYYVISSLLLSSQDSVFQSRTSNVANDFPVDGFPAFGGSIESAHPGACIPARFKHQLDESFTWWMTWISSLTLIPGHL